MLGLEHLAGIVDRQIGPQDQPCIAERENDADANREKAGEMAPVGRELQQGRGDGEDEQGQDEAPERQSRIDRQDRRERDCGEHGEEGRGEQHLGAPPVIVDDETDQRQRNADDGDLVEQVGLIGRLEERGVREVVERVHGNPEEQKGR